MRKKINKMSEWSAKTEFTPLEVGGSGLFMHTAQRDAVQDGKERQQGPTPAEEKTTTVETVSCIVKLSAQNSAGCRPLQAQSTLLSFMSSQRKKNAFQMLYFTVHRKSLPFCMIFVHCEFSGGCTL